MTLTSIDPSSEAVDGKPTITVREYEPSDHAAMVKLYSEAMATRYDDPQREIGLLWRAYTAERLRSDLADVHGAYVAPGGNFWVAVATDASGRARLAGMAGLRRRSASEGEVRSVFVGRQLQRLGVGRRLLAALRRWAEARGLSRLWLTTVAAHAHARAFYAALGFRQAAARPPALRGLVPLVRLEMTLGSEISAGKSPCREGLANQRA